jgi:hypothetical protein
VLRTYGQRQCGIGSLQSEKQEKLEANVEKRPLRPFR